MTESPALSVQSLTAGYGNAPVIRDVGLTVGRGEVVSLLGANGAGKTTTLAAVCGAIAATSGSISVNGERIRPKLHHLVRHGIGYVPDGRCLFTDLTVAENLRLARGSRSVPDLLKWFPALERLLGRKVALLSGGEQQMLALARALALRPTILLVDEMSNGLAPVIVEGLLRLVRSLADTEGISVLVVEQHVDLALKTADRGYVMRHGEIVRSDSAERLLQDRGLLEASYLGDAAIGAETA